MAVKDPGVGIGTQRGAILEKGRRDEGCFHIMCGHLLEGWWTYGKHKIRCKRSNSLEHANSFEVREEKF